MTQSDVVNYLLDIDEELKNTYEIYQELLHSIKSGNYKLLKNILYKVNNNI